MNFFAASPCLFGNLNSKEDSGRISLFGWYSEIELDDGSSSLGPHDCLAEVEPVHYVGELYYDDNVPEESHE